MAANVVISAAGRCPAAGGGATEEKNEKQRKIGFCLIVFGGLSLSVLYGYFTEGEENKRDTSVGIALLEALAGQFIYFSENDVRPRHFRAGRIGGPGRG